MKWSMDYLGEMIGVSFGWVGGLVFVWFESHRMLFQLYIQHRAVLEGPFDHVCFGRCAFDIVALVEFGPELGKSCNLIRCQTEDRGASMTAASDTEAEVGMRLAMLGVKIVFLVVEECETERWI